MARVRAFEHASGVLMLEFYEHRPGRSQPKRVRLSLGHRDQEKAKQQADEAVAKLGRMEALKPEELTLQELFDIYGREVTPTKGKSKRDHDERARKTFLQFFGPNRIVSTLSKRDWGAFIRERRCGAVGPSAQPVGDRQIEYDLKFLVSVLNWANDAGNGEGGFLLERNPLKECKLPEELFPARTLIADEDYAAMLTVADQIDWRFRAALVLALSANVRETRSTQRIRVGRRQRKRTCWDCAEPVNDNGTLYGIN